MFDYLIDHENTPPYIARRLIERFTTSNPSPRYVHTVANAFATGATVAMLCGGDAARSVFVLFVLVCLPLLDGFNGIRVEGGK